MEELFGCHLVFREFEKLLVRGRWDKVVPVLFGRSPAVDEVDEGWVFDL